jgi:hypothetical protein
MYIVPKNDSIQYAWDDVAAPRKLLVLSVAGQERVVDLLRFGKQDALSFNGPENTTHFVEIQVLAEGPVIVLKVSPLGMKGNLSLSHPKLPEMVSIPLGMPQRSKHLNYRKRKEGRCLI